MPDGERVGRGYIEIRPELDQAAFEAAKARIRSQMNGVNRDVARDYVDSVRSSETDRQRVVQDSDRRILRTHDDTDNVRAVASRKAAQARADVEQKVAGDSDRKRANLFTQLMNDILPGQLGSTLTRIFMNPALAAIVVVAGATLANALASGFLAAGALALLGAGIAVAISSNPEFKTAGAAIGTQLWHGIQDAAKVFEDPLYNAFLRIQDDAQTIINSIHTIFANLAPAIPALTTGLIGFTNNLLKGLEGFSKNMLGPLQVLGNELLPKLGNDLGKFLTETTKNSKGVEQGLRDLFGIIDWLLGTTASLIIMFQYLDVAVHAVFGYLKQGAIDAYNVAKPYLDAFGAKFMEMYNSYVAPYAEAIKNKIVDMALNAGPWFDNLRQHAGDMAFNVAVSFDDMYNNHIKPNSDNISGSLFSVAGTWSWLGGAIGWVVTQIAGFADFLWNVALKPVFSIIWFVITTVMGPVFHLLADVVGFVFQLIKVYADIWWAGLQVAFGIVQIGLKVLGTAFQILWDYVVRPVFNFMRDHIEGVINAIMSGPIGRIMEGIRDKLPDAVRTGVNALTVIWDGLKKAVATPINFVINTVLNGGILKAYNAVAKAFAVKPDDVHVDPIPGYAEGGILPGKPSKKDNMLAWLATGEYVMPTEQTAKYLPYLEAMRNNQLPHFDGGGIVGWFKDAASDVWHEVKGLTQDIVDFATNPAKKLGDIANKLWDQVPGAALAKDIPVGAGKKLVQGMTDWVNEHITKLFGSGSADVATIQNWLKTEVDPLPYVWGAVGPNAYDCSGLVGEVIARLLHLKSFSRYFVTGPSEDAFLKGHGFQSGFGSGNSLDVGMSSTHTMGRLAGLPFEAQSSATGIFVGSGTSDINGFPYKYHLDLNNMAAGVGGTMPGGNLGSWIATALQITGSPASWASALATLVMRESGGNPNAINNWDMNAAAGHPSSGLAQVIGPTFAAYHQAGTSNNIMDPVANLAAAINYMKARYGGVTNVQQANPNANPHGYDNGGYLQPGWNLAYNGLGHPELVQTPEQYKSSRGSCVHVHVKEGPLKDFIDIQIKDHDDDLVDQLYRGAGN